MHIFTQIKKKQKTYTLYTYGDMPKIGMNFIIGVITIKDIQNINMRDEYL